MTKWTRKRRQPNKANSRTDSSGQTGKAASAADGTHRAKQSQFALRRPGEALPGQGRKHGRPWRQACETKPISRAGRNGRGPARSLMPALLGQERAKQSQFPGSGGRDGSGQRFLRGRDATGASSALPRCLAALRRRPEHRGDNTPTVGPPQNMVMRTGGYGLRIASFITRAIACDRELEVPRASRPRLAGRACPEPVEGMPATRA
jgi:hypothetical protein